MILKNFHLFLNVFELLESIIVIFAAVDLAKEQKLNYGDDMTSVLRQARKRRFQLKEEQRLAQDIELQTYLNQLILEDAERHMAALDEQIISAGEKKSREDSNDMNKSTAGDSESSATAQAISIKRQDIESKKESAITRLNDLFAKVDERRRVCYFIYNINTNLIAFKFIDNFYWHN